MTSKTFAISRAVGVIGATAVLATGVTFAALQSNVATLSNTSVTSSTASLKLWDGDSFELVAPGYTITNLVPGTGSAVQHLYMQNDGQIPLNVTAHVPAAPSASGFSGWENFKVKIASETGGSVETNMQALLSGNVVLPANPLSAGATGNSNVEGTEGNYTVTFDIDPSSTFGNSVSVGSFNIDFTGTQPETPELDS